MNEDHYEFEKAGASLQAYMNELNTPEALKKLGDSIQLLSCDIESHLVSEYDEPKSWRLSGVKDDHSVEPLSLRIQGIISNMNLPPIKKPSTTAAADRMRPHIRQSITLAGLGAASFAAVVDKIDQIHMAFQNHLPAGTLNESTLSYYRDESVISAHNRFFTAARLVPNQPRINFDHRVDPDGYLKNMTNDAFVHIEDNEVEYFAIGSKDGKTTVGGPNLFRCGDIVEIIVEFCAFPAGSQKYTLMPLLRGIRMLNSDFRTKAAILEMRARKTAPTIAKVPKRKSIYSNEELENTRKDFQKLRMMDTDRD